MARLTFRQGIVKHQDDSLGSQGFLDVTSGNVSVVVSPEPTIITFCHGNTNYLYTEATTVNNAWGPFSVGTTNWLYWEINRVTGVRTFGSTNIQPLVQPNAPSSPVVGSMWFDTIKTTWKEWNGAAWVEKIRVFACKLDDSLIPRSMSINSPMFVGTQVGLTSTHNVGSLVFDTEGKPLIKQDGKFFTTEDLFITGVPTGASLKINNVVMRGIAQQPLADFQVVEFSDFNEIVPASPVSQGNKLFGMVELGVPANDVATMMVEGLVMNPDWDWVGLGAEINDPIYINPTGMIQLTPVIPEQLPMGIIFGPQEIFFAPRLFPQVVAGTGGGSGAELFTQLLDTPGSYVGHASEFVRVNATSNGIEFYPNPGYLTDVNWGDIGGTLSNQTDLSTAIANATGTATWGSITGTLANQTDLINYIQTQAGGVSSYFELAEVPATNFVGAANNFVRVNSAGTELVFGTAALSELTDTPSSYAGAGTFFVRVNAAADGIEYVADPGYITGVAWSDVSGDPSTSTALTTYLSSNTVQDFLDLGDVAEPDFTGHALQYVRVNATENALQFDALTWGDIGGTISENTDLTNALSVAASGGATQLDELTDVSTYTLANAGNFLTVNGGGTGTAWVSPSSISYNDLSNLPDLNNYVPKIGDSTIQGNITIPSSYDISITDAPVNPTDAVNKLYVDNLITGIKTRAAVSVYVATNLSGTYNNGIAGQGATLSNSPSVGAFPSTVDGTAVQVGDRILVANQTTTSQNGIYIITNMGSAGSSWILTRDASSDTSDEIPSSYVFVQQGTTYGKTAWVASVDDPEAFVTGTSSIDWVQFGQSQSSHEIIDGNGDTRISVDQNGSTDTIKMVAGVSAGSWTDLEIFNASVNGTTLIASSNSIGLGSNLTLRAGNGSTGGGHTYILGGAGTTLDGGDIVLTGGTTVSGNPGDILINRIGTDTGILKFVASNGTSTTGIRSHSTATTTVYTLPQSDGTVGQHLETDGSGNLSWANPGGLPTTLYENNTLLVADGVGGYVPSAFLELPRPYDMAMQIIGTTPDATVIFKYKSSQKMKIFDYGHQGDFTNGGITTGANTTFTLSVNGISKGTLNFDSATDKLLANIGDTPSGAGAFIDIEVGDVITITSPATADANMTDVSITLRGYIEPAASNPNVDTPYRLNDINVAFGAASYASGANVVVNYGGSISFVEWSVVAKSASSGGAYVNSTDTVQIPVPTHTAPSSIPIYTGYLETRIPVTTTSETLPSTGFVPATAGWYLLRCTAFGPGGIATATCWKQM